MRSREQVEAKRRAMKRADDTPIELGEGMWRCAKCGHVNFKKYPCTNPPTVCYQCDNCDFHIDKKMGETNKQSKCPLVDLLPEDYPFSIHCMPFCKGYCLFAKEAERK